MGFLGIWRVFLDMGGCLVEGVVGIKIEGRSCLVFLRSSGG